MKTINKLSNSSEQVKLNATNIVVSTGTKKGKNLPKYLEEISKDVYSNEEVKTNKIWTNNKPIYRKVITDTLTSQSQTKYINIADLNIEKLTFHFGNFDASTGISPDYFWGTGDGIRYNFSQNYETLTIQGGTNYPKAPITCTITLEYTKTTD